MRIKCHKVLTMLASIVCVWTLGACDKEDDPGAIDVKNLKHARSLSIVDYGDGSIQLRWLASNFEKDFEGYNIYGAEVSEETATSLAQYGFEEGKPLQLLDAHGQVRAETKEILQLFNFDPKNPLVPKTTEPSTDGERKISFLPIHQLDGEDPILPTCYPTKAKPTDDSYTCDNYTKANVSKVKDKDNLTANGLVTYDIDGLTAGVQYCFIVFSVQDGGKEISQMSTNVECVRPSVEATSSFAFVGKTQIEFKVRDYIKACDGKSCPDISDNTTATDYFASTNAQAKKDSTGAVYFETYGGTGVYILSGQNCGVLDLGVRTTLSDDSLLNLIPTFTNEFGDGSDADSPLNKNGYTVAGASTLMLAKHIYVVACTDTEDDDKSYYHLFFVDSDTNPNAVAGFSLKIRAGLTSIAHTTAAEEK